MAHYETYQPEVLAEIARLNDIRENTDRVADLLQNPVLLTTLMSEEETQWFDQTLFLPDRVATSLPPAQKVIENRWYWQGFEPTCSPWAFAHASIQAGIEPDPQILAQLFNQAKEAQLGGQPGLRGDQLLANLKRAQNMDIGFVPGLRQELLPPHLRSRIGQLQSIGNLSEKQNLETVALNIIDCLNRGLGYITSVNSNRFERAERRTTRERSHAISISGYQVLEGGFVNTRLTDSARGIYWTSLDFLIHSSDRPISMIVGTPGNLETLPYGVAA